MTKEMILHTDSKLKDRHALFLAGLFFAAFLILIPLFKEPYQAGHDTKFHIANILSIENQILEGQIPASPVSDHIGYGLGYGARLFYPPLAHTVTAYVSAFLSFFGFSVTDSLKLVHFLMLSFSGIAMYFLSFRLTKNRKIAFLSGIIYMFFPYHISDIYARDSLAECFLFPFLPMILSGIYELLEGRKTRFYPLFVTGYAGGICSHFTLMLYFTLLLAVFLLFSWKKVFQKAFLLPFLTGCLCVLGSCAFFLSTMIENRFSGDYVVFAQGEMSGRIAKTALWPFEYLNIFPFLQGGVKFHFPVLLCILLAVTFLKRKQIVFPEYTKNFLLFGILAFLFSTKLFPWKWVPGFFQMIQFPWRFEVFLSLIVSLYAPLCLNLSVKKNICSSGDFSEKISVCLVRRLFGKNIGPARKYAPFLLSALLLVPAYGAISRPAGETIQLDHIWWNGGMGWQKEYLPVSAKENKEYLKKKKQTIAFIEGEGTCSILKNHMPDLRFSITAGESSGSFSEASGTPVVLELPRIYYPGYQLLSESGETLPLKMSAYGLLQAEIPESGTYTLRYTGTLLVRTARKVSVFTVLISICAYLYIIRRSSA